MIKQHCYLCALGMALFFCVSGCGQSPPTEVKAANISQVQMTSEVWTTIPESPEKYDQDLLNRLHKEDPKFKSNTTWKTYVNDVVAPGAEKAFGRPVQSNRHHTQNKAIGATEFSVAASFNF